MATIDILGVPHAYDLTAPSDSPQVLVFIHGWLLSRQYWQPLIDLLSPTYQCLCYDLRGFGCSQPIPLSELNDRAALSSATNNSTCRYAPAAYARDLGLLLERLNISSAWLIGHSLGGTIALWAAAQLPHCVKGVICLNAGGGIYLKEAFEQFRAVGERLVKFRPRWLCNFPGIDWVFTRDSVARPIASYWGRQRALDFAIAHPEAARGTLLDSTTEAEVNRLPELVSRLKQPVYFIAGAKDTIMEPKYVRHLASFHQLFQACGDNVIEIADCGHLAMVEQPEAVASQIRNILGDLAG